MKFMSISQSGISVQNQILITEHCIGIIAWKNPSESVNSMQPEEVERIVIFSFLFTRQITEYATPVNHRFSVRLQARAKIIEIEPIN